MKLSALELAKGILCGQRNYLAQAITLIESSRMDHIIEAKTLMNTLAKYHTKRNFQLSSTFRLGITGPPGAGKSTLIECLGMTLVKDSHNVAVIPVDPSSHISGGSILGDKTRMNELSKQPNAYIRASPTRGVLGGVARHTADVIFLCEAVGIGQSEVELDSLVDMLVLVIPPGSGDGLQASKKGIVEAADLIIVNKADGDLLNAARHSKADYESAMNFIRPKSKFWKPKVSLISAVEGKGVAEVLDITSEYHRIMVQSGHLLVKRQQQAKRWMRAQMHRHLQALVDSDYSVLTKSKELEESISSGTMAPLTAASILVEEFLSKFKQ